MRLDDLNTNFRREIDSEHRLWLGKVLGRMATLHDKQSVQHGYLADLCHLGQGLINMMEVSHKLATSPSHADMV